MGLQRKGGLALFNRLGVQSLPVLDAARRQLALGEHVVEQEVEQRGDAAAVEENAQLVARRRAA